MRKTGRPFSKTILWWRTLITRLTLKTGTLSALSFSTKNLIGGLLSTWESTWSSHHLRGWTTTLERYRCTWKRRTPSQLWIFMRIPQMTPNLLRTHLTHSNLKLNVTLRIWKKSKNPLHRITTRTTMEVPKTKRRSRLWPSTIGPRRFPATFTMMMSGRQISITTFCESLPSLYMIYITNLFCLLKVVQI